MERVGVGSKPTTVARGIETPGHGLSKQQLCFFWDKGYLGPLVCEDPNVRDLPEFLYRAAVQNFGSHEPIPEPSTWPATTTKHVNVHDPHRHVPEIMAICAHPSIVIPVAQLLGCPKIAFFQSRFRVKFPQKPDAVPWHQDVGESNGGYRADGSPVPSITVWLSVDGATKESGSLRVVPRSHTTFFGNWRSGFNSKLEESGQISEAHTSQSLPIEANPGEFYIFHSWTLHRSTTNTSASPRSALVLRFVAPGDAVQPQTEYTLLPADIPS